MKTNKLKIINDPVHGFVKLPYEILFDVIEHPYFQRLRRISQTGLLSSVFPGATHTRFHHAIGAMYLMFKALETLKQKGVEIAPEEEQAAMLAILLHDIGHGPYSHALESVLVKDWHHEKLSLLLMKQFNQEFSGALSMAIEMFRGQYSRPFFNQLISSQLDVDRMDYLKRDSFYTGVSEGNINTDRIISMLNVSNENLVVDAKGIYSIENYLAARMMMYWQVYYHKTASLAETLLVKILTRAKELITQGGQLEASENLEYFLYKNHFSQELTYALEHFTQLDDTDVLHAIKIWQNHEDLELSYYCKAIIDRRFPQTIVSAQKLHQQYVEDKIKQVNRHFGIDYGERFVQIIHRELLPYDNEKQPIYLLDKDGTERKLEDIGQSVLLESLKQKTEKYILTYPREIYKE